MSTHRYIDAVCLVIVVLTVLLTLLFMNGESFGLKPVAGSEEQGASGYFTGNDLHADWDRNRATQIILQGDQAGIKGSGAYFLNGDVCITDAGSYLLSGSLTNGSILVDTDKNAKVWILLDGVDLCCDRDACLHIEQADKVFLTLAEGSENRMHCIGISDRALEAGVDGVIFSRDDLTINGTGSLTAESELEHGIAAHDVLTVTGGKIRLRAPLDAIHVKDGVFLMNAELRLEAGDDGISVNEPESRVYMESGVLEIHAEDQGITAFRDLEICGGNVQLQVGGDGLRAKGDLCISGGDFRIEAGDEALFSEEGLRISGGEFELLFCADGIKAMIVEISGGNFRIRPRDDGIVARVRNSVEDLANGLYMTGETRLTVSGGKITIDLTESEGTALNAHRKDGGTLEISGGELTVLLPTGEEVQLSETPTEADESKQLWK